jgi:hypothetical protein
MEQTINVLLFDKSNNLTEEAIISKPKTFYELLDVIKIKFKNYQIFITYVIKKTTER